MASRTKGSSSMTNTVDVSAGFIHTLRFCRSLRRTLALCVTLARFHGDDNYAYGYQNLGRVSAVICAVVLLRIRLKILYQMFHANATGQEPRSFRFHQRESAFTSVVDPHDPLEINYKVTFGMSVTGFLPVGIKVRNPRVSEPALENEPLLGLSIDSRNLQHRSSFRE